MRDSWHSVRLLTVNSFPLQLRVPSRELSQSGLKLRRERTTEFLCDASSIYGVTTAQGLKLSHVSSSLVLLTTVFSRALRSFIIIISIVFCYVIPTVSSRDSQSVTMTIIKEQLAENLRRMVPSSTRESIKSETMPEDRKRDQWDRPIEFLFTCIAMCVGLGNVWRLPYTAYENGGGAFLIPYLIVVFFIGKPMYLLELAIGQFSSRGQVKVWKLSPIFKGVGYATAVSTCCVASFYCMLMAVTFFYLLASFTIPLPWTVCSEKWEGITCEPDGTAWSMNASGLLKEESVAALYFSQEVMHLKSNINDGIGLPDWKLTLCLLFSWILIFCSLAKGVRSAGKVAYFTALFPYAILITLLIRGVTLDGAWDGIKYFITPKWDMLLKPQVWFAAITQCFFSLNAGFGPIIMVASYNPFEHNIYRDATVISMMDTFTSLLAGLTVFAILGNLSHELKAQVPDVAGSGGPGLAFITYPLAISKFEWGSQLFAVLFFLMLYTLAVGSATSMVGVITTVIQDRYPNLEKTRLTACVSVAGFLLGLIYITPGGLAIVGLVDRFAVGLIIFITAFLETTAIAWVYGLNNLCRDLEFMLKRKISFYWRMCWGFIIPISLLVIFIHCVVTWKPLEQDDKTEYPAVAMACGWTLTGIILSLLPISAIHVVVTMRGATLREKFTKSFKPAKDWGPRSSSDRQEWMQLSDNASLTSDSREDFV